MSYKKSKVPEVWKHILRLIVLRKVFWFVSTAVYVLHSEEHIKVLNNNKWNGESLVLSAMLSHRRSSECCLVLYCFIYLPSPFQLMSLGLTKADVPRLLGWVRSTMIWLFFFYMVSNRNETICLPQIGQLLERSQSMANRRQQRLCNE